MSVMENSSPCPQGALSPEFWTLPHYAHFLSQPYIKNMDCMLIVKPCCFQVTQVSFELLFSWLISVYDPTLRFCFFHTVFCFILPLIFCVPTLACPLFMILDLSFGLSISELLCMTQICPVFIIFGIVDVVLKLLHMDPHHSPESYLSTSRTIMSNMPIFLTWE